MKPLPQIYRFIIGIFVSLLVIVMLIIWLDNPKKPGTSAAKTTQQITVDSLNRVWLEKQRAYEDSLQQVLSDSTKTLRNAATKFANKANKLEGIASDQQEELDRLRQSAPAECRQIVTAFSDALDTCNSKAGAWHSAYSSEYLAHKQTLLKVNSLNRETQILDSMCSGLKRTNTTLKDRNTTIVNRMNRGWLKRNWLWARGRYREYVLK